MQRLTSLIRADREFKSFLVSFSEAYAKSPSLPIAVNGLSGGAENAFIVESLIEARKISGLPVLLLAPSEAEREKLTAALCAAGLRAEGYKGRDLVFSNIRASHDTERERLSVLHKLISGELDAVVSTPSAAALYTMPKERLASLSLTLSQTDIMDPAVLAEKLVSLGYAESDIVDGRGRFSRRGGIVDFFGGDTDFPVRVEFFGDEVDRLMYFDPLTQRSISSVDSVTLLPASEVIITSEARAKLLETVRALIKNAKTSETEEKLRREEAIISSELSIDFRDKYLGVIYEEKENLFTYLSSLGKASVMISATQGCIDELSAALKHISADREALLASGSVNRTAAEYSSSLSDYNKFLEGAMTVHVNPFSGGVGTMKLSGLFGFRCRRTVAYGQNPKMLHEDLSSLVKGLYRILLVCENKEGARSLSDSLISADFAPTLIYDKPEFDIVKADGGRIFITVGEDEGYDLIMPKIAVLSMKTDSAKSIAAARRRKRILKQSGGAGKRILSYADLNPGDYVVHANYGIGLFEGMQAVKVDGITKDYITIRYAGTDKLFVPCDRLEMIGKYIGARSSDGTVKLSKMGGGDWTRAKSKAKSAARDIAKELIAIYAQRQRKPGFAFPGDCDMELEFDGAFEYELTESQAKAVEEIKGDMQKSAPMNRLLCGDVGFGKTEVALRAAFKAIMGGKQVAILVPTTILALQHYQTALSRFRGYPVSIEMLSRFKRPREQQEILRKAARGECDILIGTHKLLSKNLKFRDLGLLIIDEEQRFGVSQKERLKDISTNVDVLTLTATPIPRTLNMAMNGISDISILDEAPEERRPVQTYVLEHDDEVIFDAIKRELSRGGQVLYLYNKVEDIDLKAAHIIRNFPDAHIAFAHGQMEREELEDIWQLLCTGEIDILVCTTIIETGIDLPAANTLIIENADRFGLAQLHQIRGRVGRSERQAYAYFTYRPGKALSEVAEKRLSAIKEYAEFGAGFKIALCDLEIRGAGNLLGAEQHGYMDSVGYDLYVKLLNEAVLEEQGQTPKARVESQIDMKVNAHIPERYIRTSGERMEIYKKISLIMTPDDENDVADEIVDRFGDMPAPVERLLAIALAKALCENCGFPRIEDRNGTLSIITGRPDLSIWSEVFEKYTGMRFAPSGDRVMYRYAPSDPAFSARNIMKDYYKAYTKQTKD